MQASALAGHAFRPTGPGVIAPGLFHGFKSTQENLALLQPDKGCFTLSPRAPPLRNRSSVLQRTAAESRAFRSPRQRRGADFQIRSKLVRFCASKPPSRSLQLDEWAAPEIRSSHTIASPFPRVRHAAESEFRAPEISRTGLVAKAKKPRSLMKLIQKDVKSSPSLFSRHHDLRHRTAASLL